MKHFNFWALALVAIVMAACSSEDELTQSPPAPVEEDPQVPIIFSSNKGNTTRAGEITGSAAADLLGKKFVVTGYKGSQSTWAANDNSIVFDNYVVEYAENTAFTTESNVANWEYVGKGLIKPAQDKGITRQTIKYWDYTKDQYDFIAWSTGKKTAIYEGTPGDGEVLVSAITPETAVGDATTDATIKAYTFTGKAKDLQDCYISDMVTVEKADYAKKDATNPVTLTFRSLGTKVRIGIYETIPGYSVRNVKFYDAAAVALKDEADATNGGENKKYNDTPRIFTTVANNIYTQGTYTVYFPTVDKPSTDANYADNNQAHVKFEGTGDQSTIVDFGALNYTIAEEGEKTPGSVYLGRSSNAASFAGEAEGNYFTQYLPNEGGTNLNLRVNYTLESIDGSGEIIEVKGATAQIPSIYTQWKSGFAYTYLFKISDKTNGYTGKYDPLFPDDVTVNSEPAGLYPITFDAMIVDDEATDKTQETITLVSTPSITTYQKGSTVVNDNEYKAATGDIFVTVNDGGGYVEVTGLNNGDDVSSYYKIVSGNYTKCESTETADGSTKYYRLDPVLANGALQTLTDKAALYTIPVGKTEAEVIDALQMQDDDADDETIKGRSGLVLTKATFTLTDKIEYGVDGSTISIATDQALRFTPAANTYAFVYTRTAPTTENDEVKYEALDWDDFATGQTKYRYGYKDAEGTYCQKGVKYFSKNASDVYTMITAFVGQSVSNLYVKDGDNYVIASGLVVPGTTYYYTTNNGVTYKECFAVSYNTAKAAGKLYTFDGTNYTAKAAGVPVDGTAYYYLDGTEYKYAVIHPQKTENLYELDTTTYVKATETDEVVGQTYFDKFTKNDGVYYVKVIKVE